MTSTLTIEELWSALRNAGHHTLQRRVDATHPLDLYLEFEPPARPGFVAVCGTRPPAVRPLRAITIEDGHRGDGRWSFRLSLDEASLLPVFAALCRDIIGFTRTGVDERQLASAIVTRLDYWRKLFERDNAGLGESELRGLIGELSVLELVLDRLSAPEAIAAWTGPLGTPQDFMLPTGRRVEVKAVRRDGRTVRINGLAQLDSGNDPLDLAIVRVEETGIDAKGAVTAPLLVDRIRARLDSYPDALASFGTLLAFLGWHENMRHLSVVVRIISVDRYEVNPGFPRLTTATVPDGVQAADYVIILPPAHPVSAGIFE